MVGRDRLHRIKRLFKAKDEPSTVSSPASDPSSLPVADSITVAQPSPVQEHLPPNPKRNKLQEQLWNDAYDNLRKSGNKYITEYEEILQLELEKDNPTGDSVSLGSSHEERWRNMQRLVEIGLAKTEKEAKIYEKVNDGLELFGTVRALVEPAVSAVPQAAIPWVGVCFILEVISNPARQPGIHREGLQYVLSRVDWYWNLAELLLEDNLEAEEGVEKTFLSNLRGGLRTHVLNLYERFLSYLIESVCYFHKNRANAFLKSVVRIDYWSGKITDIKAAEQELQKSSKQYNSTESRERLSSLVINVKSIESALQRQTRQQLKLDEDASNKICLRALYTTDPLDDKRRIEVAKGGLLFHCSSWIFTIDAFQTWHQDPDRRLLWIKGDPGKGKTMLLCGIVDRLDELTPNRISCFFCQATEDHQNNAVAVLRGLIWSLVCQHPALVSHVRNRFDSAGEKAFTGSNAWHVLSEILKKMILDSSNRVPEGTTIIIDALDECTENRDKLLELIVEICAEENSQVKWIVSSRNWVEFEDTFMDDLIALQRVILPLEDNEEVEKSIAEAVNAFVGHKVRELEKKKRSSIEAEVHDLFIEKSGNTFLWVALAYERLLDKEIEAWQILDTLKELPSGLKELYNRMMQDVERSSHGTRCKDILAVVALVHRPISLAELSSSAQSLSRLSNHPDDLKRLVLRCGCFLVVPEDVVLFMHQSAKDYLLEDQYAKECVWEAKDTTRSHRTIFLTLLETMRETLKHDMYDLKKPGAPATDFLTKSAPNPLAPVEYACCYWADHILSLDDETARATLEFCKESLLYWLEACSLLGKVPMAVIAIQKLQKLVLGTDYHELANFLQDANRFILYFKTAIEQFPLQTYTSGLLFSPRNSLARQAFEQHTLDTSWLSLPIPDDWDACVQTLEGHTSTITSMAFSRNGRWLASASEDYTMRIWDVATGVCLQTMDSPYAAVYAVAFSTDSSCLASASEGFTIRFWDTTSDKFREIRQADTRGTILIGLLFSPDGEWLASWSRSWSRPEVEMRNAKTGDCIYRITLEERVPLGSEIRFAFSSDSQRILVGSEQPGIWDVSGRTWINHLEVFPDRLLTSASSSEGTWVGHVYGENGHSIWNISETESVRMAEFLREDGFALPPSGQYAPGKAMPSSHRPSAISDDGTHIATCTESPFRLAIVDAITGAASYSDPQIARGTGNGLPELMTWSADSQWLAVAGIEGIGQIKIWDPKAIKNSSKTHEVHKSMRAMAFTADGRRFACGYEDGIIEIQDMASPGITLLTLEGHDSCVQAVVFSPSGNMLATQCAFLVKIWNIEATGECLHTFAAGQIDLRLAILPPSWPMAFSTDDSHFAFGQGENAIEVHGLTEQSMYQLKMDDITSLIFLPNRLSLAAGDKGRNIKIWDLGTKDTQERMFESDSWSLGLAFSSDGNLLAQSTTAGQIFLWEMSTGDCLCKLETEGQIRQLSFSPDDKSFMTEHGCLIPEHWPCNIDSRSNEAQEDDSQEDDSQEDDTQNDPIEVPFISQGYGIGFDGTWLTKDGERLVWLPPEHRRGLGFQQNVLVAGSVVAIRNSSNQLSMYYFDH